MTTIRNKYKYFYWLLGKLNISQDEEWEMIKSFTNNRSWHKSQMTEAEYDAMVNKLRQMLREKDAKNSAVAEPVRAMASANSPEDKMRKKIISICHEMGWKLNTGKIDMKRVNEFCEKRGKYKKKLDAHTKDELRTLITQFEKALRDFYKGEVAVDGGDKQ